MRVRLEWVTLFAFASFGLLQKSVGFEGCFIYLILCIFIFWYLQKPIGLHFLSSHQFWLLPLGGLLLVAAYIIFKIKFPHWESKVDRNEALDLAVHQILQGSYPYDVKTQLNNPLSPFPGAIFLAFPFVLLGSSSYQNFFWLIVLLLWMRERIQGLAVLGFLITLGISLPFLQEWLFGGDLIANNIYVLIAVLGLLHFGKKDSQYRNNLLLWGMTIFFGMTLSSRPNFIFWFPIVFVYLARTRGWSWSLRHAVVTAIVMLAVTLPFWLYAPSKFSPLHAAKKIEVSFVWSSYLIIGLMVGFTGLGLRRCRNFIACLGWGALIQAIPVICIVLLDSFQSLTFDFSFTKERYGLNFVIPGCVWFWYKLNNNTKQNHSSTT